MASVALLTPSVIGRDIVVVNGRTYPAIPPGTIVVASFSDSQMLSANGFSIISEIGTTSQRPAPLSGKWYSDSTLSKMIIADGNCWRDPQSGSAV